MATVLVFDVTDIDTGNSFTVQAKSERAFWEYMMTRSQQRGTSFARLTIDFDGYLEVHRPTRVHAVEHAPNPLREARNASA
jgi:hypothetical protein